MMQFLVSRLNFSLKLFPLHIDAFRFALRFSPFVISNYRWFYQVEILLRRMKLDLVSVYRWMRLDRHMVSHCRVWSKMSEKNRQSHNALLIMHMCVCACGLTYSHTCFSLFSAFDVRSSSPAERWYLSECLESRLIFKALSEYYHSSVITVAPTYSYGHE